jgi:hypothetical protein
MANDTATKAPRAAASKAGAAKQTAKARAKATAARSAGATKGARPRGATTRSASLSPGSRSTVELVGDYAERAVLIPVGVALTARDSVVSGVNEVITSYSSPAKAQTQLRRFERRGSTARNRLEREVRKTRTRIERELRERRRELDRRREGVAKGFTTQVEQTQAQIEKTQSQIEGALRARLEDGADLANRVQERVLHLV